MTFKFKPMDRVCVLLLDCPGRVTRCILYPGDQRQYSVEYCLNGEIRERDFYEDDLN